MRLRRKLGWGGGGAGSRRREPVVLVTLPGHQTTTGAKIQQKAGEFPVFPPPPWTHIRAGSRRFWSSARSRWVRELTSSPLSFINAFLWLGLERGPAGLPDELELMNPLNI